ncbi:MAG: hypothetical protein ACREQQ_15170 [Candidatus Binatia bacterium]
MNRRALLAALGHLSAAAVRGIAADPEFQVNSHTAGAQAIESSRAVAADGGGSFVVVWTSKAQDGGGYGIFARRHASNGAAVGTEFRVNTITAGDQLHASVAADESGNFIVAWDGADGAGTGIQAQRFSSDGGALGSEFAVNGYVTYAQKKPSVAISPGGDFVVVWQSGFQDDDFEGVFGRRFASSGAALGTDFRINTYTTGDQLDPRVAFDSSGASLVVWWSDRPGVDEDGSDDGVFGQRFSSGGDKLGTQLRVNSYTTGDQSYPSLAADGAGGFIVVWQSLKQDGSADGIFAQRYSGGGSRSGSEFRVHGYLTGAQRRPDVAQGVNGDFTVAWSGAGEGDGAGIFGRRVSTSGEITGDFRVNSYTTSVQDLPSVASGASGTFVVVWRSQDGDGSGVFGRILSTDLIFRDGFE